MTFALKLGPGFDGPPLCAQASTLGAGRVAAAAAAVTAAAATTTTTVSTVGAAVAISVAAATGTAALTTAATCHLRPTSPTSPKPNPSPTAQP